MIARRRRPPRDPTLALINIVFLMLVFFLVAGQVAPPLDPSLTLVRTADLAAAPPPDALVIHADGRIAHRGADVADLAGWLAAQPDDSRAVLRLVPDRDLPAERLVSIGRAALQAGAGRIVIVTEQGARP